MFVLNPALLMIGSTGEILIATATGAVGVVALGAAVAGHVRMRLLWIERASLFGAAVVLIHTGLVTDLIGALLLAPVVIRHYRPFGQRPPAAA
jgi:TRAP-type uncharacterized transport system fused permease subunit